MVVPLHFNCTITMPFSPEIEEEFRLLEEDAKRRWEAMTEPEREKMRGTRRRFAKKVESCYPPDADYSYSSSAIL